MRKTILLVEDEALIAMTQKMALEKYGYAIQTASTGEKAIEVIETASDIDLVLMDINLGDGIDGTEAAGIILKDHDIPIVFVSSHTEPEIVEKTEKITSYGYVVKNSSITVLDASIKMAFKLFEEKMISQNKEKLIYEHEAKYRLLHEHAGISIGYYNLDGIVLSYNQLAARNMGGVPDDFTGKSIYDLYPKSDADSCLMRIRKAASSENSDVYEDIVPLPAGRMYFLNTFTRILDISGSLSGIQIISQNITERKRAEKALENNQERLRFALEGSNLGEWDLNLTNNRISRNNRWAEMLGYELAEIKDTLQQGIDLQHPDDRESISKAIQDHLDGNADYYSIEYRMRTKSGTYKWIRDCGKIMERDVQGNPLRICGTHADIDENKKLESMILDSNILLHSMFDSSPDVIVFALDTNYRYLAFNSRHKEVIKKIWGKEICIGTSMLDVIGIQADGKRAKDNFDRALSGESFVVVEDYGDDAFSRQSWLDYWSPIKNIHGSIIGLTCFLINNTRQKKAQEKIKNLLSEKELLLKEVHHRIKNNMNTISSLLSLQASAVKDVSAVQALQDAGNRIKSMSLLYDKLYLSPSYTELSIHEYLSPLINQVVGNFPDGKNVKIKENFTSFMLDVKCLQPLGVIINELLTNIMKYAFRGKDTGSISVSATYIEGHVTVSVQDDGIGINENITFENSTGFGLHLVHALAQQLDGTIRLEREAGTRVVLDFVP